MGYNPTADQETLFFYMALTAIRPERRTGRLGDRVAGTGTGRRRRGLAQGGPVGRGGAQRRNDRAAAQRFGSSEERRRCTEGHVDGGVAVVMKIKP